MKDSPLSITANVTGILTFAAAILAFIYVRCEILSNGRMEMKTIWESVQANNEEIKMMTVENGIGSKELDDLDTMVRTMTVEHQLAIEKDDDADTIWLKKLRVSLFATDYVIFTYCTCAAGVNTSSFRSSLPTSQFVGTTPTTLADAMREVKEAKWGRPSRPFPAFLRRFLITNPRIFNFTVFAAGFMLRLGTSPTLVRWYRVRERVLKRIGERETLRSQLLSHQVSMANSSARESNQALQRLLEQQTEVKVQLEELTRLVTMANQGSVRPESVSGRESKADTQSAASLGQQGSAQPCVDDGDAQR